MQLFHYFRAGLSLALIFGAFAPPARAQTPPDSLRAQASLDTLSAPPSANRLRDGGSLQEIVVRAERPADGVRRVSLLTLAEGTRTGSLNDALAARLGIYVHQYGPGRSSIRVRGWDASHTEVLLDGRRLADPHSGQFDLAAIPTSFLESATLARSAADRQGSLGGTISLRTVDVRGGRLMRATAGTGQYGRRSTGFLAGAGGDRLSGVVAVDAGSSPNGYPIDGNRTRQGAERTRLSTLAKATLRSTDTTWEARYFATTTESGLPGPANAAPRRAGQDDSLHDLLVERRVVTSAHLMSIYGSYQWSESRFQDLDGGLQTSSTARRVALGYQWQRPLYSAEVRIARQNLVGVDASEFQALADAEVERPFGQFRLHLGARVESRSGQRLAAPRIRWVTGGRNWGAHVHAARTARFPTFVERYWSPGGNSDLVAETGLSAEAGGDVQYGPMRLQASAFLARLKNRIAWHPSLVAAGLQIWRPVNVGRVLSRGVEAAVQVGTRRSGVGVDASWTAAEDRTDPLAASFSHQLRYVPRVVAAAEGWTRTGPITLSLQARHTGRRPIASDGSFHAPAFTVVNASAAGGWTRAGSRLTLSASLNNVFNTFYEVIRLYPMPGRNLSVQLQIELH